MAGGAGPTKRVSRSAPPRRNAAARILDAAAAQARARGAAAVSLQDVADRAGVSKGLIHYHFHDRETLLARLAEWLADAVVARERAALADATPHDAIDRLWEWLDGELTRGDIRLLAELGREPGGAVQRAVREAAIHRRAAAAATAERLFASLGLSPRVAPPMLADVLLPFVDGLALDRTLAPERQRRVAFDILWLALLGLAD